MKRVLIAGGGIGGLEAALALCAMSRGTLSIDMISSDPRLAYRPWSVTAPFGDGPAVELDLRRLAAQAGFGLIEAGVTAVDPHLRCVATTAGDEPYDALILALGARPVAVVEGAFTFRGPQDAEDLTVLLDESGLASGARIAFVANASAVWALPAYELALQTAARAARSGRSIQVALVTAELGPLQDFGPESSARVGELLAQRGIELHLHTIPESFERGSLFVPMAGTIPADVVVALPGLVGRPLPGIPHDAGGFVDVDDHCRVIGLEDVYAIGDMTARELKQGGLAAQQADVAATVIAAAAGLPVTVEPYRPVLRAMLLTGEAPLMLNQPPGTRVDKITATHIGPYLATHAELLLTG